MPAVPRQKNLKATKIAFDILGEPENLKAKRSKRQKKIDIQLLYQDTSRVR
jgi:hypothetical protein